MKILNEKKLYNLINEGQSKFGYYQFSTCFDYVQTHYINGINGKLLNDVKNFLKNRGKEFGFKINYFRKVKAHNGSYILCFKVIELTDFK